MYDDTNTFIQFTLGDSSSYSNKISFRHPATFTLGVSNIPFSSDIFKEIFELLLNL